MSSEVPAPILYIHTCMCHIVLWTYHLIKNRICPSISVAPRISSATSPLRNPLGSLGSGTSTLLLWFSPMCREVIGLISCNTVTYNFQAVVQHTQVCVYKKFTGFRVNIKWKRRSKKHTGKIEKMVFAAKNSLRSDLRVYNFHSGNMPQFS